MATKNWPNFKYKTEAIEGFLFDFAQRTGRIGGVLDGFSESEQAKVLIKVMVFEAIKTSEIKGEYLSRKDVMSSTRGNLGLHPELSVFKDKRVEGASGLMLAVRREFSTTLS